ncbi:unnamed protein product [Symbiodinium sp. KB8]|nr:unnamed protein product [Symbiodinium sp. KB8]
MVVGLLPSVVTFGSAISACERQALWQTAISQLSEVEEARLRASVVVYNSAISSCEKGEHWQLALYLLGDLCERQLQPSTVSCNAGHFELPRGVPDRHRAEGLAAAFQASGGKHYVTSSECWARCSFDGNVFENCDDLLYLGLRGLPTDLPKRPELEPLAESFRGWMCLLILASEDSFLKVPHLYQRIADEIMIGCQHDDWSVRLNAYDALAVLAGSCQQLGAHIDEHAEHYACRMCQDNYWNSIGRSPVPLSWIGGWGHL